MAFKWCSIGTKGPKVCQENIPHTITLPPTAWTIEIRQDGSMLSCSSDQATFFQSSIITIAFPVLSWQERHPVWYSAAVTHLLQGSTCCAFRDGTLHTLVVTSGYLSYCCLSIISNQSAPPFSSDLWHQQGIFVHTTAAHWIFSLFWTILCKP